MLVSIESKGKTKLEALSRAADVALALGVREGLMYPESLQHYFELVKSHKNNKRGTSHLILARSHYELLELEPERIKRQAEHFFQRKGGSVWGTTVFSKRFYTSENYVTFGGEIDNLDYLELQAKNDEARELYMRSIVPTQYYGRTQTDPHTLVVGISPKAPLIQNKYVGFIYEGMPEDWWNGVAFLPKPTPTGRKKFTDFIEWMDVNVVSVGEDAHVLLDELEISHGAAPDPQAAFKLKMTPKNYSILLRETTRTQENKLDW